VELAIERGDFLTWVTSHKGGVGQPGPGGERKGVGSGDDAERVWGGQEGALERALGMVVVLVLGLRLVLGVVFKLVGIDEANSLASGSINDVRGVVQAERSAPRTSSRIASAITDQVTTRRKGLARDGVG
jgi:hypothetical protein